MAKKAYSPDPKAETIKRIQRTEAYAEKVRRLFAATVNEILALNKSVPTYPRENACQLSGNLVFTGNTEILAIIMAGQLFKQLHCLPGLAMENLRF